MPDLGKASVLTAAEQKSFQDSRIYAQGWNAGRRLQLKNQSLPQESLFLNPYPSGCERARWNEGFFGALA